MRAVGLVSSPVLVVFGMTLGFFADQAGNGSLMLALIPIGIVAGIAWLRNLWPLTAVAVSSLAGILGVPIASAFC